MPHLSGIFEQFPGLEKTSPEELMKWLRSKPEIHFLVNYLGNRILYPQTVPLSKEEMELDLVILREAIKLKPGLVFQPQTNRILIPKMFLERFPNLTDLARAIVEGINPKGVHLIYVKDQSQVKMVGSVISPLSPQKLSLDEKTVVFTSGKTRKALPLNQITIVQSTLADTKIVLGTEEYKALGGEVGIIIDLRLGGFG